MLSYNLEFYLKVCCKCFQAYWVFVIYFVSFYNYVDVEDFKIDGVSLSLLLDPISVGGIGDSWIFDCLN